MCRSIFQLAQHPGPAYLALADSIETAIRAGDVVQVLVLANPDGRFALGVDGLERGQIGSAFINRHRLRGAVLIDRLYIVSREYYLPRISATEPSTLCSQAMVRSTTHRVLPSPQMMQQAIFMNASAGDNSKIHCVSAS